MFEGLFGWFQAQGLIFMLLGMYLVLLIDSTTFPVLPELFVVLVFTGDPSLELGVMLLAAVCLGELTGNTLLYTLVKRKRLPDFLERAIRKWVKFLVFSDERTILMNRFAPVVPYTGAFIATCKWDYKRSMAYLVAGCIVKYTVLLSLVAFFAMSAADMRQTRFFSLAAILAVIGISFGLSRLHRRRLKARARRARRGDTKTCTPNLQARPNEINSNKMKD